MSPLGLHHSGSGMPILLLHGFTQSRTSASDFRELLTPAGDIITVDLPGHGDHATVRANLSETADLLAQSLPEPVAVVGYSLGGRIALHLAVRHPHLVSHLVTIGATPGIRSPEARALRRQKDAELATRITTLGLDPFLHEWTTQPLFAHARLSGSERESRRVNTPEGLATSLLDAGTGTQEWLGEAVRDLTMPTFFIAGVNDVRFSRHANFLATQSHGRWATIAGAGHAAHLDQPALTASLVRRALA